MTESSSERELERLSRVYAHYRSDDAVQARWSADNPGNQAVLRERARRMREVLAAGGYLPLTGRRVLEVGCGAGSVLAGLQALGAAPADLYGVDLLPDRIEAARRAFPDLNFSQTNAEALAFDDETFDLILLFTVFTSILDRAMAQNVADEVQRVLKRGGSVLWYDFRYDNPRNPQVRGLQRDEIAALFSGCEVRLQTLTLVPPLARRLGRLTPVLYPLLSSLPWLRTHYLGLLRKR